METKLAPNLLKQKAKHECNFTSLNNEILLIKHHNKPITEEILGTFWRLMSLDPSWHLTISGYCKISGCSQKKAIKYFATLEELGYLKKIIQRDEKNRICKHVYFLKETLNPDLWDITNNNKEIDNYNEQKINTECNEMLQEISTCTNSTMWKNNNVEFPQCGKGKTIKYINNKLLNNNKILNNKINKNIFLNLNNKNNLLKNTTPLVNNKISNNINLNTLVNDNINNIGVVTKLNNSIQEQEIYGLTKLNSLNKILDDENTLIDDCSLTDYLNNESEEQMKIPGVKKPKGYKKETEPEVNVAEILPKKETIMLSEQTEIEKQNASLKRQLQKEKEANSILKQKIGKSNAKEKRMFKYIEQHFKDKPELCVALANFTEMFIEKRGTITIPAFELLLSDLNNLATDEKTQIEIVNNSVKQSYIKFYPISNSKADSKKNNTGKMINSIKTSENLPLVKTDVNTLKTYNDKKVKNDDEDVWLF